MSKKKASLKVPDLLNHFEFTLDPCPWWDSGLPIGNQKIGDDFLFSMYSNGCHSIEQLCQAFLRQVCGIPRVGVIHENFVPEIQSMHQFLPGHRIQVGSPYGPVQGTDVVVIGRFPGDDECFSRRYGVGYVGQVWIEMLERLGVDVNQWYITSAIKIPIPDGKITADLRRTFAPFLYYELMVCKPKIIVCMGADAVNMICGDRAKFSDIRGGVIDWEWPVADIKAKVLTTFSPRQLLRQPELESTFQGDILKLHQLVSGECSLAPKTPTEYYVVRTIEELEVMIDYIISTGTTRMTVDCEWAGHHPHLDPASNYLRSVQVSWGPGKGAYFSCTDEHGNAYLTQQGKFNFGRRLKRLFEIPNLRLGGYNLRADLPWLFDLGIVGIQIEDAIIRGFDAMLASHVIEETASHGLGYNVARYTDMGRYDTAVNVWINDNGGDKHLEQHGYRFIPDRLLIPYALGDVDGNFRLWDVFETKLQELHQHSLANDNPPVRFDGRPSTPATLFYDIENSITLALYEMEATGLLVDVPRLDSLTKAYNELLDTMQLKLQNDLRWPGFNPGSIDQCRALLFQNLQYKGRKENVAPEGAKRFDYTPVKASGKAGKPWERLNYEDKLKVAPSTDSDTLGTLMAEHGDPEIKLLHQIRMVSQMCKNFLAKPNEEGVYEKGLKQYLRHGRIHTSISQLTETGRYRSSEPNCFSGDTDLLTDKYGWMPISELYRFQAQGIKVAQYDAGVISFTTPFNYIKRDTSTLLHIHTNTHIDLCVTDDHRCLLVNRKTLKPFEVTADNYCPDAMQLCAGDYSGGEDKFASLDYLRFLIAVQADGTYVHGGGIELTFKRRRKIERLRSILDGIGIAPCRVSIDTRDRTRFYFGKASRLAVFVCEFLGDKKEFGSWIFALSRKELDCFIDEVSYWDGCRSSHTAYSSNSRTSAGFVQAAFTLSGKRARLREYRGSKNINYQVDVTDKSYSLTSNIKVDRVHGESYCLSVQSSYVVTRRNGNVAITGQCQNIPKSQEKSLGKILSAFGFSKVPKIRSCFIATPGWLLVEKDYKQAELFTMAWYSGDETMMEILSDPNRSLHYETAVRSYGLQDKYPLSNYTPEITEKFKSEYAKEYVIAKGINFGIPYGLGAIGLLINLRAEGIVTTLAACKEVLEKHKLMYPKLHAFLDSVAGSVTNPGYFQNIWGRRRRFVVTQATDNEVIAGMQRESKNFPIQSSVADNLSLAIRNLWEWKRLRGENRYRLLLPVHDAIIAEVHPSFLRTYVDTVAPSCMCFQMPKLNIALDIDIAVGFRWGEHATEEELLAVGVEADLAKRFGHHN